MGNYRYFYFPNITTLIYESFWCIYVQLRHILPILFNSLWININMMWGSVSSHAHRLCPHCSSPGFKSWPGAVCCVSLPLSQSVLSLKTYKGQKNPNVLHSAQHTHTQKNPHEKKSFSQEKMFSVGFIHEKVHYTTGHDTC